MVFRYSVVRTGTEKKLKNDCTGLEKVFRCFHITQVQYIDWGD